MRILVVSAIPPCPPDWGAAMRVHQLVRHLSNDHTVTLVTYGDTADEERAALNQTICDDVRVVSFREVSGLARRVEQAASLVSRTPHRAVSWHSEELQAAIDLCLTSTPFDIVHVESSLLMCFRYPTRAPLVLDEHNIESEVLRRQARREGSWTRRRFNALEARKQEALENRAWRRASAVAVTSEREVPIVIARSAATPVVRAVPNGVDPSFFAPGSAETGVATDSIVFTGLLTYRPNLDAVRHFLDAVFPLIRQRHPGAVLTIVGGGPARDLDSLRQEGVVVTGRVPDLRPHLARAACVIAPIRMGGGTRLKVLEALSMGRPMVSTSLGCEGIDVRSRRHLLVADAPEDFASAVCTVLDNPAMGEALGRAGRELVVAQYSWRRSADLLASLYADLVASRGRDQGSRVNSR